MDTNNNSVDFSPSMGYNYNQDELYDRIAENYLSAPQIIKMNEQRPLGDKRCKHKKLVADPDDSIGEAIYHGCANPKCSVGFYIRQK